MFQQSAADGALVLDNPTSANETAVLAMDPPMEDADVGIDVEPPPLPPKIRVAMLAGVILPPVGAIAAMVLLWGGAFQWIDLMLLASMYLLTGLGVTIGFHRLCTHRSFAMNRPVAAFFVTLGSMSAQGPVIWWCATHRRHHMHSDHEFDPHSPHASREPGVLGFCRGFLHAHIGWLFDSKAIDRQRYVPDLLADPLIMRLNRWFPWIVAAGILLPGAIAGAVTGTWSGAALGVLWGGLVRIFMLHHATWSVNSVCHVWGQREYRSGDESRNNPFIGLIALGEGWHNNHHAFPASARHGLKWWQFDLSWIVIRSLQTLGLVSKVRLPAPDRLEARRRRPAAAPRQHQ